MLSLANSSFCEALMYQSYYFFDKSSKNDYRNAKSVAKSTKPLKEQIETNIYY